MGVNVQALLGLTAKSFGPHIVYSGVSTIGLVSNIATGGSFSTASSSAEATAAESACDGAQHLTGVGAIPVNFQGTYLPPDSNGTMHWRYTWQSSTGNLADLAECKIDELVIYPGSTSPYVWPHPMVQSTANPTAPGFVPMGGGFLGDLNLAPRSYITPYFANDFTATQRFQYLCPGSNLQWIGDTITIHRKVYQPQGSSNWTYEIDKSGQSATATLP